MSQLPPQGYEHDRGPREPWYVRLIDALLRRLP